VITGRVRGFVNVNVILDARVYGPLRPILACRTG